MSAHLVFDICEFFVDQLDDAFVPHLILIGTVELMENRWLGARNADVEGIE